MENKSIYIIGGGISLKDFDFDKLKDKTTIAVNKSCKFVSNLNYFITMDFTALNKIKFNAIDYSLGTKVFIANFTKPYLQEIDGRIVDTRFNLIYKLEYFDMIIKSRAVDGLGLSFNDFRNGDNSGYCALQLAIVLGYKEIYLLGIDLISEESTHFHGGYGEQTENFNKKLESYYQHFYKGLLNLKEFYSEIKIYSCSLISRLNTLLEYKEL